LGLVSLTRAGGVGASNWAEKGDLTDIKGLTARCVLHT
jgi:hypothetical protein